MLNLLKAQIEFKRMTVKLSGMRFFVLLISIFAGFLASSTSAVADQNDPGLEALFLELKDGSAIDADETQERILEIWSKAPSPSVTLIYERAFESYLVEDYALAEELLNHVVGLAPAFAQGWFLQAQVKLALDDYENAYASYQKVLTLEPRHFIATSDLAAILQSNGDEQGAFDLYQQALRWNPHYAPAREEAAALREVLSGQDI